MDDYAGDDIRPIVSATVLVIGRYELNFFSPQLHGHLHLRFELLYNGVMGRTMTHVAAMLSWVRQRVRAFCATSNHWDGDEFQLVEQAQPKL